MNLPISQATLATAAPSPVASMPVNASSLLKAAYQLLPHLHQGQAIDAARLRAAMTESFGGSDGEGAWDWKAAYDACEASQILFLRKFGLAMRSRAPTPGAFLAMLDKLAHLFPTHTRRSEESQALQQFSTPIALGYVAAIAAALTPGDLLLEPSAGTGLLAIFADLAGARLLLNELAATRANLLAQLFADCSITQHDAAHIDDSRSCTRR